MVSRLHRRDGGFTLVELLVVMVVMGIVGAATLAVVTTTSRAQRAAADTRVKLDGTRIAVQRVREELREADEICSDSDSTNLRFWVDADDNGNFDPTEIVVYRLRNIAPGDDVFERFVPATGATRLIRGDVLNAALFDYQPVDPGDQLDLLQCDVRTTADVTRTERTTVVGLTFTIATAAGQGIQNLSVDSAVRLRNSGVFEIPPNQTPTASFTYVCTSGYSCAFDASASTDPDGVIASYAWEFGDATVGSGKNTTHLYPSPGSYTVTVALTVTDDRGGIHRTEQDITLPVSNNPPTAVIKTPIVCAGPACSFQSTGTGDPDGDPLTYAWKFGDGATATGASPSHTYTTAGTYTVELTVTDPGGLTGTTTVTHTVAAQTFHLDSLTGTGNRTGNTWRATVVVRAHNQLDAPSADGTTITYRWEDQNGNSLGTNSCPTTGGQCTIQSSAYEARSNKAGYQPQLTFRVVNIGGAAYNPSSNHTDPPTMTIVKP